MFVVSLGVIVLAGWFSRTPALVQLLPHLPPMTRNAAACFVLCGLGLFMATRRRPRWPVALCAGTVGVVSVFTLLEFVFDVNAVGVLRRPSSGSIGASGVNGQLPRAWPAAHRGQPDRSTVLAFVPRA